MPSGHHNEEVEEEASLSLSVELRRNEGEKNVWRVWPSNLLLSLEGEE